MIRELVAHVAAHAGVDDDRAALAIRDVLIGIGAHLRAAHRELVAEELPAEFVGAVRTTESLALAIEERVRRPGITAGQARELVASVCRVLAEQLSTEALEVLRGSVPPSIVTLLETPSTELGRMPLDHRRHETLARGRSGSRKPISEAVATRAQPESVLADNPHADRKLSSAPGSTQEQHHDTLAEGRDGSELPVASRR